MAWREQEITVEEGIAELTSIHFIELQVLESRAACQIIPTPRPLGQRLLAALGLSLPDALPLKSPPVATKKRLVSERKR